MDNKINTDPKICFATNLKKYMKNNNISRKQLSDDLEIKYSTLCEWLKGTMLPRSDKMDKIAKYFKVTSSDLLEDPNVQTVSYQYPFVSKIPAGYTLEQASKEFFQGWGQVINSKNPVNQFGLICNGECNPMQPHFAKGEPVSFIITNKIDDYDEDYVIRRDGHDAEIVRIFRDQSEIKYKRYIMVPVYNDEGNYQYPYEYDEDELGYEILGKVELFIKKDFF